MITRLRRWSARRRKRLDYRIGFDEGWETCAEGMLPRLVEMGYLTQEQYIEVLGRWGV